MTWRNFAVILSLHYVLLESRVDYLSKKLMEAKNLGKEDSSANKDTWHKTQEAP